MIFHVAESTSKFFESLPQPRFNSNLDKLLFRVSSVALVAIASVCLISFYPLVLGILMSAAVVIAGDCLAYLIHSKNAKPEIGGSSKDMKSEIIDTPVSETSESIGKSSLSESAKSKIRKIPKERAPERIDDCFPCFSSEMKKELNGFESNISNLYGSRIQEFFCLILEKGKEKRRSYGEDVGFGLVLAVCRLHQEKILTKDFIKAFSDLSGKCICEVSLTILGLYDAGILTKKHVDALLDEKGQYARVIGEAILCLDRARLLEEEDLEAEDNLKTIIASKGNAHLVCCEIVALHKAGILNGDTRQILLSEGGKEAREISDQIQNLHRQKFFCLENQKALLIDDAEHALSIAYAIGTMHAQKDLSADEIQIIRGMIVAAKENACIAVHAILTLREAKLLIDNRAALSADDRMRESEIWRCIQGLKKHSALNQENLNLLIRAKRPYVESVCQGVLHLCINSALDDPKNREALLTGGGEHARNISGGIVSLHKAKLLKPEYREALLTQNGKHAEKIADEIIEANREQDPV